mgnify:CR=1 FL=1
MPFNQISIEQLSHFICGVCGKWWTIGDAPVNKKQWFCPWCGVKQNMLSTSKMAKISQK